MGMLQADEEHLVGAMWHRLPHCAQYPWFTGVAVVQDDKDRLKAQLAAMDASQGLQQLHSQVQQLHSQLAKEQRRYAQASTAAGEQVLPALVTCLSCLLATLP